MHRKYKQIVKEQAKLRLVLLRKRKRSRRSRKWREIPNGLAYSLGPKISDWDEQREVLVGGLALRIPAVSKPTRAGVHAWEILCLCEMKLDKLTVQKAVVPLITVDSSAPDVHNVAASFDLEQVIKLSPGSCLGVRNRDLRLQFIRATSGPPVELVWGRCWGNSRWPWSSVGVLRRCFLLRGWKESNSCRTEELCVKNL